MHIFKIYIFIKKKVGSGDDITPMLDAMDMYHSSDEEEEFTEIEDDEEEPDDPFVDNLIAQWADLRDKVRRKKPYQCYSFYLIFYIFIIFIIIFI